MVSISNTDNFYLNALFEYMIKSKDLMKIWKSLFLGTRRKYCLRITKCNGSINQKTVAMLVDILTLLTLYKIFAALKNEGHQ